MGVWLTEKGVHSTHIHRHAVTLYWKQKRAFSPLKKKKCILVFGYCSWGLSWKRKRASISQMAELMWAMDFPEFFFFLIIITWPGFSACRCGMWKTVCSTMCSWLKKNKKSIKSSLIRKSRDSNEARFALTVIIYTAQKRPPNGDESRTGANIDQQGQRWHYLPECQ